MSHAYVTDEPPFAGLPARHWQPCKARVAFGDVGWCPFSCSLDRWFTIATKGKQGPDPQGLAVRLTKLAISPLRLSLSYTIPDLPPEAVNQLTFGLGLRQSADR